MSIWKEPEEANKALKVSTKLGLDYITYVTKLYQIEIRTQRNLRSALSVAQVL